MNFLILFAIHFVASAHATQVLVEHSLTNGEQSKRNSSPIIVVGDIDLDGVKDFAIGQIQKQGEPEGIYPYVKLVSGKTFKSIAYLEDPNRTLDWKYSRGTSQFFGSRILGLKDINNDGASEILVSDPDFKKKNGDKSGAVFLFCGRSRKILRQHYGDSSKNSNFGRFLADLGDLNRDGFHDYSISTRRVVYIYSGRNGELLDTIRPPQGNQFFDHQIFVLGDQDGDQVQDLLLGSPQHATTQVFSGRNRKKLFRFYGGVNAALGLKDFTGDSRDDFIANFHGRNRVFYQESGKKFHLSFQSYGRASSILPAGDFNGDGKEDVIITYSDFSCPGKEPNGLAQIFSPSTGQELVTFVGGDRFFGSSLPDFPYYSFTVNPAQHLGDVDGDGTPDYLFSQNRWYARAWAISGKNHWANDCRRLRDLRVNTWKF